MTLGLTMGLASAGMVAVAAARPPAPGPPTESRRIAVVVGVDAHHDPAIVPLRHAGSDARALGQRLTEEGYELWPVVGTVTTRAVWQTLARATASAQAEDLVVVYFAGRARAVDGRSPAGEPGRELRLLCSDAAAGDPAAGIGLTALDAWLSDILAERRVVIVDALISDGPRPAASGEAATAVPVVPLPRGERSEAWILAPARRPADREDLVLGQGIFSRYLLEALSGAADLDGNGQVGVLEAFSHAGQRTAEHTTYAQVPRISAALESLSALPLAGTRDAPLHAVLLWTDPGWRRWELRLDGERRGPGPVAPGPHDWELVDPTGQVEEGSFFAMRGDLLSLEALRRGATRPVGPPPVPSPADDPPGGPGSGDAAGAMASWTGPSSTDRGAWQHGAALGLRVGFPGDSFGDFAAVSLRSLAVPRRIRSGSSVGFGGGLEIGILGYKSLLAHASWFGGPGGPGKRRFSFDLGVGPGMDERSRVHTVVAPAIQVLRQHDGRRIGWWVAGARARVADGELDVQLILSWSIGLSLSPKTLW